MDIQGVVHWVTIKAQTKHGNGDLLEFLKWDNLSFDLRMKYNWYFNYRAALLQVTYPKAHITHSWGHREAQGKTLDQITKNRKAAKKRKITEIKNKLRAAREDWNQLFPIEDHPNYKKAIDKLRRLEAELEQLEG